LHGLVRKQNQIEKKGKLKKSPYNRLKSDEKYKNEAQFAPLGSVEVKIIFLEALLSSKD